MTAQVIEKLFVHEHNRLAVAEQEYQLAQLEYEDASAKFDALDPKRADAFHNARERRSLAWDRLWALKRGY